jgi:hypothetical protein
MIFILALVPWVLTVIALLFIMVHNRHIEYDYEEEPYDYDEEDIVRVAVYDEKAYWVYENVFYESDVTREPDFTTARPIDTMSMSPKQLNKLLNILDELENNNERE